MSDAREAAVAPRPVADAGDRRAALDPGRSFIVQAPAGSGKTELLVQRFLRLLAEVDAPEQIVAITFTRKAAGEMRDRILGALQRAADEPRPAAEHEAATWDLARAALERDRALGWNVLQGPARLRLRTVDSLRAQFAAQMPWLSRSGGMPAVEEDATPLYREAARLTIEQLGRADDAAPAARALDRLLGHLDNDVPKLVSLLEPMLRRRDQWMRHVFFGHEREGLENALAGIVRAALAAVSDATPPEVAAELPALARYAAAHLEPGSPVAPLASMARMPGDDVASLPEWLAVAWLLLTKEGETRRSITKTTGFPPEKTPGPKARMAALLDGLAGEPAFVARLKALRLLPTPRYDDAQWDVLDALVMVLKLAVAQLRVVFQRAGSVDYVEVAQAAEHALKNLDGPTDLAIALDEQIRHLLVDEFQDTSVSELRLIGLLTREWSPGDGRTLFVVGDPMQSIYLFRQAEVSLFLDARRRGLGDIRLEPLRLTTNFRSDEGVVRWVNEAFERVFPAEEDALTGAVAYSPSTAHRPPGAGEAVTLHALVDDDGDGEAARVVEIIEEARAADATATTAVLVRAKSHLGDIAVRLRRRGIPFQAIDVAPLSDLPLVQDLLALTRALVHPADRIAWLAVLRAPWCGLTLADLHALVGDAPYAAIRDLAADPERRARLGDDGRTRLDRVIGILERCLRGRRRRSLRRWIEGAWLALGGPACLGADGTLEDAHSFFALLEGVDVAGDAPDLDLLATRAGSLFAAPDPGADGTLQLMSIHKAKGLEFDNVIVPGLGRATRGDDARLLLWLEVPKPGAAPDLLLAPIRETGTGTEPTYEYVKRALRQKEVEETRRLLYVAATRAKHRLHLFGHVKSNDHGLVAPRDGSLLNALWPVAAPLFEERLATRRDAMLESDDVPVLPGDVPAPPQFLVRLAPDFALPAPPPGVRAAAASAAPADDAAASSADADARVSADGNVPGCDWAGWTRRHVGTVVHRVLQQIARRGLDGWDAATVAARRPAFNVALAQLGVPAGELAAASLRVENALAAALADPRGRWVLDAHEDARAELALGFAEGEGIARRVIDRTFLDGGTRWIVDYKTSQPKSDETLGTFLAAQREQYRAQLEGYAALFASLDPAHPVRLGLYFPLVPGGWIEWS